MAQGTIKKGFFFYFGLFVLLLITVFMICVVIMIFNPGHTILWLKYFTFGNDATYVETYTGENGEEIDVNYRNVKNYRIMCGYANVIVQRNKDINGFDGVVIENNSKGFATYAMNTNFEVKTSMLGDTLVIEITEPTGFLFFSNEINVIINSYDDLNRLDIISERGLEVKTTSGDVVLGSDTKGPKDFTFTKVKVLADGKSDIVLGSSFDTSKLTSLSLETADGTITSRKEVSVGAQKTTGFSLKDCDVSLTISGKGQINLPAMVVSNSQTNTFSIECHSGNVVSDYISATGTDIDFKCEQGNYKLGTVVGNMDFTNSEDVILAPNIMIEKLEGNFSLSTDGDKGARPNIHINEITGNFFVLADRGNVTLDSANGSVNVTGKNDISIHIKMAEQNTNLVLLSTNKGTIDLTFLGDVGNDISITSNSNVNVNITSVANFVANCYKNDNEETPLPQENINISHGLSDGASKNPFTCEGSSSVTGGMKIYTNAKVNFNLISAS